QLSQLRRNRRQAVRIALTFAAPVFLVIVLGGVPLCRPLDSRDCSAAMFGIPARDGRFGFGALTAAQRDDRAAVLGANIVALAVELRRIVRAQEYVEYFPVRNDRWIVRHPDCLGVACRAAADLLVCRVGDRPADVAALD